MAFSGRKRRRHRWDSSQLRVVLVTWSILAALTGAGLAVWGGLMRIDRLFQVGIFFLGSAILAGLLYGLIAAAEWMRNRWRDRRESAGMALVMILALLALLTGPVVHSLALVQMRLVQAERERDQRALRATAAAVFCRRVEALARGKGSGSITEPTPGGGEIRCVAQVLAPAAVPPALRGVTGELWSVSSQVMEAGREFGIDGYVVRTGAGTARILVWLEQGLHER